MPATHARRPLIVIAAAAFFIPVATSWPHLTGFGAARGEPKADQPDKKPGKSVSAKKNKRTKGKVDMSAVPADEKEEKKDARSLGEGFKLKRTLHYSVFYDTSEADLKTFSEAIEKTYRSCLNYTQKLGFEAHPPKHKLIIYYFENHPDYSAYAEKLGKDPLPEAAAGVCYPDLNRSMFYNFRNHGSFKQAREAAEAQIAELREQLRQPNLSPDERRSIRKNIADALRQTNATNTDGSITSEETVQHEVTHQVLWNIGFHNKSFYANPHWLVEGTAMMFEPISTGSSANFGRLNEGRLEEYRALVEQQRLIPLPDFVSTADWFYDPRIAGAIAYPQAWALTHYLNRAKRGKLREYVELINKRKGNYVSKPEKEIADFEKCFGKIDDRWVEAWLNWMKKVR